MPAGAVARVAAFVHEGAPQRAKVEVVRRYTEQQAPGQTSRHFRGSDMCARETRVAGMWRRARDRLSKDPDILLVETVAIDVRVPCGRVV